jgi:RNA-directed DNA polymerase
MKESHRKDLASHPDPESCGGGRKAAGEALTGAHAGQPLSCEIRWSGVPTPFPEAEGHTAASDQGEPAADPAQSQTLRMRGNSSHGSREVPQAPAADGVTGRPEKVKDRASGMYAWGKSDGSIVCAGQHVDREG